MTILVGATISTMTGTMTTLISRAGEVTGVDSVALMSFQKRRKGLDTSFTLRALGEQNFR